MSIQKITLIFTTLFVNIPARVAELVDAHGSGPCIRKNVLVQLQSRALLMMDLYFTVTSTDRSVSSFQTPSEHVIQSLLSHNLLLQSGRSLHP